MKFKNINDKWSKFINELNKNQIVAKARSDGGQGLNPTPGRKIGDSELYLGHNYRTAKEIDARSIKLLEITNDGTMIFFIRAFSRKDLGSYKVYVQFQNWDDVISNPQFNAKQKAQFFIKNLQGQTDDTLLHCTCPSWRYHYNYVAFQQGAAINPEYESPDIQNPYQMGVVCKHARRIVEVFPSYYSELFQKIKGLGG